MRMRMAGTLLAMTLAACGGDDDGSDGSDGSDDGGAFEDRQIVLDYADQVVIPTYELLEARAAALDEAIIVLDKELSPESLEAAQQAWVDTRVPWEQSEGFLFGPVSAQGWDPAMDSWPLNRDDLEAVLASDEVLDLEFVTTLPETQKGFHTIEYLLWGEDSLKTVDQFDDRELEYLLALSEELTLITADLATSWTEGVGGDAAYREVFTTAGEEGNTAYPSLTSAAQEILVGMSGICDEVANGKIADPYDARDPNLVESQYSFNSEFDFQDNMRSVLNAYTGDMPEAGTEGEGLDAWVAERDPDLDERFQAEINDAIAALEAIPPPFRDAITDPANDESIEAAQQAISTVQATVDGDLSDLVLQ
jgi:putative iron-regulated protein